LPPDEMENALQQMYRFQPGRDHGKPWAWGKGGRGEGPNDHDGRGPRYHPAGPDGHDGGPRGPAGMGPGGRRWDGEPGRGGPEGPHEGPPPFRGPGPRFEGRPRGSDPLGPPPSPADVGGQP
jgi:hypothetical protein